MSVLNPIAEVAIGGLSTLAQPFMEKMRADNQGHEIDKQAEYDRQMATETFNRQVLENKRVAAENEGLSNRIFERDAARADAVWEREKAYNLELWNRQNEYNTPAAQMARFKAAGLNPRLIYGQGNAGNATAIISSKIDPVSSPAEAQDPARASVPSRGVVERGLPMSASDIAQSVNNYMRMRQVGLMTQRMAIENEYTKQQTRNLELKNIADARDLNIKIKTGSPSNEPGWITSSKKGVLDLIGYGKSWGRATAAVTKGDIGMKEYLWTDPRYIDYGQSWDGQIELSNGSNGTARPLPIDLESWNGNLPQ